MKISWNDIVFIDRYLTGKLSAEKSLLFQSRLLINPVLRLNVSLQRKMHILIKMYGRKKLKSEVELVHKNLFNDPSRTSFRKTILQLFEVKR